MASPRSKLEQYLELAREVCSLAKGIVDRASSRLGDDARALRFRSRVLTGLAVKMYNCFESLIEDAARERLEAMHHLKTLVETFIYFHWVGQDAGEKRARLVYARTVDGTIRFYKKNRVQASQELHHQLQEMLPSAIEGLGPEWENFKGRSIEQLARDVGVELQEWYDRVYRSACGPAHMGDLVEYMPTSEGTVRLGETSTSALRAQIALDYGLLIMLDLLKVASDSLELGLEQKIEAIRTRHNDSRVLRLE